MRTATAQSTHPCPDTLQDASALLATAGTTTTTTTATSATMGITMTAITVTTTTTTTAATAPWYRQSSPAEGRVSPLRRSACLYAGLGTPDPGAVVCLGGFGTAPQRYPTTPGSCVQGAGLGVPWLLSRHPRG
jgi:hypothetical protein